MIKNICLILLPDDSSIFGRMGIKLPPLSIGIISSYLRRHGFTVDPFDLNKRMSECYSHTDIDGLEQLFKKDKIFDYVNGNNGNFFDTYAEKLFRDIDIAKYDLIAYSIGPSLSWLQTHSALILGQYVKKRYRKIQVFGGMNISNIVSFSPVYDELLELYLKNFPYVINGPGEEVLVQIIDALNRGKGHDHIKKINGVVYITGEGNICSNREEKKRIVCPDFDGLELDYYFNYLNKDNLDETVNVLYCQPFLFTSKLQLPPRKNIGRYEQRLVIPYVFNFGCPYNCAFCAESAAASSTPVIGKVEMVIDHLETLTEKYHTPYFIFINNAVNYSKRYIIDLCDGILERNLNIYWSDCARFNNIDVDILKKMKQAGCKKLVFGLEIASPGMIDRINKQIDLDFTEQVLQWCSEIGIWAELEIIVGIPTETETDFECSVDYLEKNMKYIDYLTINKYRPMPESLMFQYPERYGIELVQGHTYEETLQMDREILKRKQNTGTYAHLIKAFQFRETNGRSLEQVRDDTEKRYSQMMEFNNNLLLQKVKYYMRKGYLSMKDISFLSRKGMVP